MEKAFLPSFYGEKLFSFSALRFYIRKPRFSVGAAEQRKGGYT
jgi:hypothetical protein